MRNFVLVSDQYLSVWMSALLLGCFNIAYAESPEQTAQRLVQEQEKTGGIQQIPLLIIGAGLQNTSESPVQDNDNNIPLVSGRYLVHGDGTVTDTKEKVATQFPKKSATLCL